MKAIRLFTAAVALLVMLSSPGLARPRTDRFHGQRPPVIQMPFHRPHQRIPVVVPWHLRTHREYGWVHGWHGGYHWAPGIGWHSLMHRGHYRPTDARVFVPMGTHDRRFRGRF